MVENFDETLRQYLTKPCSDTWNQLKTTLLQYSATSYDSIIRAVVYDYQQDDPNLERCFRELNSFLDVIGKSTDPGEIELCQRIRTLCDAIAQRCDIKTVEQDVTIPTEARISFDYNLLWTLLCILVILLVIIVIYIYSSQALILNT